jgi:hypothetical protein
MDEPLKNWVVRLVGLGKGQCLADETVRRLVQGIEPVLNKIRSCAVLVNRLMPFKIKNAQVQTAPLADWCAAALKRAVKRNGAARAGEQQAQAARRCVDDAVVRAMIRARLELAAGIHGPCSH